MAVHSTDSLLPEERNVYLLQTTLERVCKAAAKVTNYIGADGKVLFPDTALPLLERDIAALRKALSSR